MNGYSPKSMIKATKVVGASEAGLQVSESMGLTAGGSCSLRVDIKVEAVTVGAGITFKLQHMVVDTFKDLSSANSSVAITANGTYSLKMNVNIAADQVDMPLAKQIRVVAVTGAGSAVTISQMQLLQEI